MPQPRRTAWALVATLVATIAFAVAPGAALGASIDPMSGKLTQNPSSCSAGQMPTLWKDDLHPPDSVRVLRSRGPNKGHVDTVSLWKYVGRVLRVEYSNGMSVKPYPWMEIGALTIKQYAWYYSMHWRGGKVPIYDTAEPPNIVGYECYDLKDSTADQIYTDQQADPKNPGQWISANEPTVANLRGMRETWHMSMRKWQSKPPKTYLFLSGYRTGHNYPCGGDSTAFKIYQKSLLDCGNKKLTLDEVQREYFTNNNLYLVDTRTNDILGDGGKWQGDLGVLVNTGANDAQWRIYAGGTDSFTAPSGQGAPMGTFAGLPFNSIIGQGVGNVNSPSTSTDITEGVGDKLFADLVMLKTGSGGGASRQVVVARSNGNGFDQPGAPKAAPDNSDRLLVGDFTGDLLADAGVLSTDTTTGLRTLSVMRAVGDGTFADPVAWWTGPAALGSDAEMAGDVNGDGKTDLVMRDAAGNYWVAASRASCADLTAVGNCPPEAVGAPGLADAAAWLTWPQANPVKTVMGDFDRDGRDDVFAVVKDDANNAHVVILRSNGATFDPQQMWSGAMSFDDSRPMAMNVNPDGLDDLVFLQNGSNATKVSWLRTNERAGTTGASMSLMTTLTDASLTWSPTNKAF